eukprot:1659119-Karenia_brevis.AAC.1
MSENTVLTYMLRPKACSDILHKFLVDQGGACTAGVRRMTPTHRKAGTQSLSKQMGLTIVRDYRF